MAFLKSTAIRLLDQVKTVLITFVLASTILTCFLLVASCIGYLLTPLLSFTLFQTTLLSAIIVAFVFLILYKYAEHRERRAQYDDFSDEIDERICDEKSTAANKTKEATQT